MSELDKLREEAKALMKESPDNLAMRSCWNCNGAHEHLKKAEYVIVCAMGCGHYYYKGQDITEGQVMHTSNTDDTSREKLRHIIGACMCKDDDKSCWYTNNAQEVENDGTVQDNQVDAILNLIDQHTKTMCERARQDELKQLWNSTQSYIVPDGVEANDMSEELHKRIEKLRSEL